MSLHPKNAVLSLPGSDMEYIRFGSGEKILIMLPGLGDGLKTVKGTALPMALMYRSFAKDFTVYAFSRRTALSPGHSTRDMAADLNTAMELLKIPKADIVGVSMGGMIAQHFAADYPQKVNRLILTVTCSQPNPILREAVEEWIACAKQGDHPALMDSNLRRIYSERYYRRNRWMIPLAGSLTKPKSYHRFLVLADACLTHNAHNRLGEITAPTLVIGGEQDNCLGGDASREIAAAIPGAKLYMYSQWGHGLYEEAGDFNPLILDFLKSDH